MNNFQQKISNRMKELPPEVQQAIKKINWVDILGRIAHKQNLDVTQQQNLYLETTLLVLGLTEPTDFMLAIQRKLSITEQVLEEVLQSISRDIISPITHEAEAIKERMGDPIDQQIEKKYPQVIRDEILNTLENPLQKNLLEKNTEKIIPQNEDATSNKSDILTGIEHPQTLEKTNAKINQDLNLAQQKLKEMHNLATENQDTISKKQTKPQGYTYKDPYRESIK